MGFSKLGRFGDPVHSVPSAQALPGADVDFRRGWRRMLYVLAKSKWLMVAAIFALCVAPTFISYQPYLFLWDDASYLRAVYSGQPSLLVRRCPRIRNDDGYSPPQ